MLIQPAEVVLPKTCYAMHSHWTNYWGQWGGCQPSDFFVIGRVLSSHRDNRSWWNTKVIQCLLGYTLSGRLPKSPQECYILSLSLYGLNAIYGSLIGRLSTNQQPEQFEVRRGQAGLFTNIAWAWWLENCAVTMDSLLRDSTRLYYKQYTMYHDKHWDLW